jgi:CheY-like chemotaxis protein
MHSDHAPEAPTILLVEDEPEISDLLRCLLEDEGYRVEVAESGADALRFARDRHPDLISLDLGLPGRSGYDVLHTLRRSPATWDIPVLIVTAFEPEILDPQPLVEPEYFFRKPLELARYVGTIRSLVGPSVKVNRPG